MKIPVQNQNETSKSKRKEVGCDKQYALDWVDRVVGLIVHPIIAHPSSCAVNDMGTPHWQDVAGHG